jgi:hypothetical protein
VISEYGMAAFVMMKIGRFLVLEFNYTVRFTAKALFYILTH